MKIIIFPALLFLSLALRAQPQLAYNGGFEVLKPKDALRYWELNTSKGEYTFHADDRTRRSGRYAMRMEGQGAVRTADPQRGGGFFHVPVPARLLAGKKKASLSAWVRTDGPRTLAGIWFNQFEGPGTPAMHARFTDTLKTSPGWQRLTVELALVPGAGRTYFGGSLNGPGAAWFDDVTLALDGEPVKDLAVPPQPPSSRETAWINQSAVPLLGVDAQDDTRDLDTLGRWMGDARIVAVGEPTHGTSEVFRLRLRLLEYLVEKKGFNTFMLEDNLAEVGLMNRYVLTGSDTALRILKGHLFPVWRNQELLQLVEWMRHYNLTHDRPLQFRGMDMQTVRLATRNLERFAAQYDEQLTGYLDELARLHFRLNQKSQQANRPVVKDSLIKLSSRVKAYVARNLDGYATKAPRDTVHWLALNAAVVAQYYPNVDWEKGAAYRDSCMADNIITYCRQYPDAKLLIWAHNSHVSRAPDQAGYWLGKHFGKGYYPVAFATATGSYTASVDFPKTAWKVYPLAAPYVGTAEYYLQGAKLANYLLPLSGAGAASEAAGWTARLNDFRFIGFMNQEEQFSPENLREGYEAVIFMRQTTHSNSFMLKKE
jgi:erythromycin esterase